MDTTDTQQAGALLERLNLNLQSSPSTRSSSSLSSSGTCTSVTSACKSDREPDSQLPAELVDLQKLFTSFLKALSLHYAHNGTSVPVDVRAITPSIAQAWGKRKVTVEDIQRCMGVLDAKHPRNIFTTGSSAGSPFFLSDYGRGKIYVELATTICGVRTLSPRPSSTSSSRPPLQAAWAARKSPDVGHFVTALPKAPITKCGSVAKASPMLARGQRTLEELKNGIVAKKQEKELQALAPPPVHADGTKMDLLDRIRHRQLQRAQDAAPPSPAELERRSALQRAADIAAVVAMLGTATARGQKRVSFPMPIVQARLRDSLRVPISKEESAACVRLLSKEIAPEWLKVVVVGGRENIVLLTDFTPSKAVIQERVDAASA